MSSAAMWPALKLFARYSLVFLRSRGTQLENTAGFLDFGLRAENYDVREACSVGTSVRREK